MPLPTISISDDGYGRPQAVRWLSLPQLVRTGFMVAQARSFALFTDQRESMAGSPRELYRLRVRRPAPTPGGGPDDRAGPGPERVPSDTEPVWVDYVSDIGDGFRATVATGRCIAGAVTVPARPVRQRPDEPARAEAELAEAMFGERPRHADLLVFGGDEVYPVGSPRNYRERLNNPLGIAGRLGGVTGLPPVAALPGNHDWYDGLAAFRRNFCEAQLQRKVAPGLVDLPAERDPVGAWGAFQSRSYFAIKLCPGWWLWAVDSQLDAPIDMEQLSYFREAADEVRKSDEDRIILCTASPSWLEAEGRPGYVAGPDTSFHTLLWFIHRVLEADSDRLRLILTGDQHCYARHVSLDHPDAGPVLVTCGGGGAFLSSTHHLGDDISFDSRPWEPKEDSGAGTADPAPVTGAGGAPSTGGRRPAPRKLWNYHLQTSYPTRKESKRLHTRWFLPAAFRNGPSLPIAVGMADIALLVFLIPNLWAPFGQSWAAPKPLSAVALSVVGSLLWIYALSGAKDFENRIPRTLLLTLGHTSAHVVLVWVVAVGPTWLLRELWPDLRAPVQYAHALAGVLLLGLGMVTFVSYLYLADRLLRCHTLEAFSGMRVDGYKSHLRLRVHRDRVDVWVVGMARVPSLKKTPNDKLGEVPLDPFVVDHFTVPRGERRSATPVSATSPTADREPTHPT